MIEDVRVSCNLYVNSLQGISNPGKKFLFGLWNKLLDKHLVRGYINGFDVDAASSGSFSGLDGMTFEIKTSIQKSHEWVGLQNCLIFFIVRIKCNKTVPCGGLECGSPGS